MYLTLAIHKGLREKPGSVAITCGDQTRTYGQLADRVARLAGALQKLGLQPEGRVGMLSINSIPYVEFFYGTWWAGGVINPCNIRWSPQEVAYSLDDCDTQILLVDDMFAPMVPKLRELSTSLKTVIHCGSGPTPDGMLAYEDLVAQAQPVEDAYRKGDDLAAIMYTGGTTGKPKGVMLSHLNLGISGLSTSTMAPREARNGDSIGIIAPPMFHVAACGVTILVMAKLLPIVVIPYFDEVMLMTAIQKHGANDMFLVPTMIKRLIEHPRFAEFDLSSLTLVSYGASPMDATLLEQAMQAFPNARFSQAYGMTELSPTITVLPPQDHLPGADPTRMLRSAGRTAPIAEVRIVDGDDNEVPTGTVGEICARGPMVMQGYWNKPKETADALRGGWMHTGDMGYMDEAGYLFVVDRLKDMIVTGGENVYSAEVENAIAQLPQVFMSAVIGVPDEKWGERVHAVIQLREGAELTEAEVIAHCKGLIAGYKCPRSVAFQDTLPMSAAGKLQKFQLRAPHWEGRSRNVS
ncbi:acyl-CoA synthetase [Comamonas serinivorans]|nr:long-chain fatty acid--CoA ligase [Comamonas serinivorans]